MKFFFKVRRARAPEGGAAARAHLLADRGLRRVHAARQDHQGMERMVSFSVTKRTWPSVAIPLNSRLRKRVGTYAHVPFGSFGSTTGSSGS